MFAIGIVYVYILEKLNINRQESTYCYFYYDMKKIVEEMIKTMDDNGRAEQ